MSTHKVEVSSKVPDKAQHILYKRHAQIQKPPPPPPSPALSLVQPNPESGVKAEGLNDLVAQMPQVRRWTRLKALLDLVALDHSLIPANRVADDDSVWF